MRHLYKSTVDSNDGVLPISLGGFGRTSLKESAKVLDALSYSDLGKPNGAAVLGDNGNFPAHLLPFSYIEDDFVSLYGPTSVPKLGSGLFKITNFDDRKTYTLNVVNGSAYVYGDTVAFAAGSEVGAASITINGATYVVQITSTSPAKPAILVPLQDSIGIEAPITAQATGFSSPRPGDAHSTSDWQIATDSDFLSIIASSINSSTNLTEWTIDELPPSTQLYLRVRQRSLTTGPSLWSDTVRFTTRASRVSFPTSIVSPANGSSNVNLSLNLITADYVSEDNLDYHVSTDWEVALDVLFTNVIWDSYNDSVNLTNIRVTGLNYATVYYVRARHNGQIVGTGKWSSVVTFRSLNLPTIGTPSITAPLTDVAVSPVSPLIVSTPFVVESGTASHIGTIYEVAKDVNFTNIVATIDSNTPITEWNPGTLDYETTYYVRVRYRGGAL